MKKTRKRYSLRISFLKDLSFTFLIPFLAILLIIVIYAFQTVRMDSRKNDQAVASMIANQMNTEIGKYAAVVETAALQESVISLDYTQAEPYLHKLMEQQEKDVWSHFLITNQYGTEQVHTEGKEGHGYSIAQEDTFQQPWKTKKTYVSEPQISVSTGRAVLGIGTPIFRDGKEVGVLIGFLRLEAVSDILNNKVTDHSYAFMTNSDGTISAHPKAEIVLKKKFHDNAEIASKMKEGKKGSTVYGKYLYSYYPLGIHNMEICVVSPVKEAFHVMYGILYVALVGIVISCMAGIFGTILLSRRVNGLVNWIVSQMLRLASGDTQIERGKSVSYEKTKEVHELYNAVNSLADALKQILESLGTNARELESTVTNQGSIAFFYGGK